MKENRLIELLDEYDSGFEHRAYNGKIQRRIKQSKNKRFPLWWNSKSFGFIQRLVQKDKINLSKSGIEELPAMYGYDYESVECKSDRLLMLLSIQDNPIEFLISILK